MATLTKDSRGRSPYWTCCYQAADGRRLKKSTKQRDRKSALEVCLALERAENAAKAGTFTEQTARKLLGEILERVTGEPLQNFKIREWFEHWLRIKEKIRSEKTMQCYRQVARDFLRSLGARADLPLTHLSSKDILDYRDSLRASKRTERTANLAVRVVSAALNTAYRQGHIARNPALAVEHEKVREAEKGVFTHEQIGKLLAAAKGDWRGAILFAYFTGARLTDTANMTWEAIDLEDKWISFTPRKTGKPLRIPLHPDLEVELLKRPGIGKAFLFPSLAGRGTGGENGLSYWFMRIMQTAGVTGVVRQREDGSRGVSSLGFHALRRTFVSAMANRNVNEEVRMKLAGHKGRDVHAGYTIHEAALLRASIEVIPSVSPNCGPLLPEKPRPMGRHARAARGELE